MEVVSATVGALAAIVDQLGPEGVERHPAPGKWNAREIISHLADCEVTFAFRFRQAMAEDHHVIQPFDQDKWAAAYSAFTAEAALQTFTAVRNWNLALLGSLSAEVWSKPVLHPERGEMTFRTLVETMGGHDLNHLRQLEGIVAKAAAG